MIKIKIRKLPGGGILNSAAKDIARKIEKDYKNAICDIHPKKTSYIILTVKGMKLKKGYFCCPEFRKKVKIR